MDSPQEATGRQGNGETHCLSEQHEHRDRDSQGGRVGGREVMGANTVPRMPSWPLGLERGQPGLANSSFTQRWSIASGRRGASPYSRGDQADASQGAPKRRRSLSLDNKGSGYRRGDIPNNSESHITSTGVRSFMSPGNEAWPQSGPDEGNAGTAAVLGGFDATTGEGASANAGFASLRGKALAGNQVQGGCTDSRGANEVWTPGPGTGVETHLRSGSELIPGERSQPGAVRESATGSSGLEQRSLTGTLATGSVGFGMGGSVNFGMSGSAGQGGGRSASGRSSGLSEVDGVPPGFMWGRGRYFAGRGLRHGMGRGSGTVFSPGPGNDPVVKLWGLKHNGVPRARAVAMAGAGAFAAAGRGNLAYALHPRKPARAFCTEGGKAWEEDVEATGSRGKSRVGGLSEAQGTDLRPRVDSHVADNEFPTGEPHSPPEKPPEQLEIENTAAPESVLKPETSGQDTDYEKRLEHSRASEERNAETGRQRAVQTQIDQERPTAVARDIDIPSLGPNISALQLDEARRDLVASVNSRRGLGTTSGRNDLRLGMQLSPGERPAVNPQAVVLNAHVAPNAPLCSDPESFPLEPGAPNSGLDATGTSGSFGEERNGPNSSEDKLSVQKVYLQCGPGKSQVGTSSSLRLDGGDCSTPMTSRSMPRVCNPSETGQGLSHGLSGASWASGSGNADLKPIEEVRIPTSQSVRVEDRANSEQQFSVKEQGGSKTGLSKGLSTCHVGTEEEDLLEPLLPMGTAEQRDGVEQQTLRKDYAMSKRERESTDVRKRLDEAEIKYRKMLEREGEKEKKREQERGRERDAVLKTKRKSEGDREGQDGSCVKKQKVCEMDTKVRWMKADVPDGDSPIIPPIRLGGGSFLKWAINIGKGGGISRSPNVLMPTVSPGEGPNLQKKPMNVSPVLIMGASTSLPVVLTSRLNTESHDGATDKNRPFLQDVVGRCLGVPSTGGSELGVVPVLKEGERVDKSEHREHAAGSLDRGQNLASTPGEQNDNFPNDSYSTPSTTRRMLSRERGSSFLEDNIVPKRSHDVDQDVDDTNVLMERTRRMEEHRSHFIPAGAGPLISTPLDCSGQLQQQDAQVHLETNRIPVKPSLHEDSTERNQEAGHASAAPEVTTLKIATYKNVRDMWICRYAPKGAIKPASSDLKQLVNTGLFPHRQPFLQYRAPQTVTRGHILTERETSGRTRSRSDAVTRPEALNMDGTQSGGVNFGTMISDGFRHGSMDDGDGSGDLPHGQTMMDYAASMSAVKAWRVETGKYREGEDSIFSEDELGSRRCWFCGLPGHSVLNCSETLDCELRDLGKRAVESGEILSGCEVLCLRCLGTGHWGAQCYLTVTEAASRASEKSQLWKLNKTRWIGSRAEKERERERVKRRETLSGSRTAWDFTSRDTAGVVCYNCNEIGHWARYCRRRRSCSGGGQSSGSGKGQQSSGSSGEKLQLPRRQDKFDTHAQVPSSGRLGHEPTEPRHGRRLEDKTFMPLLLERDHGRDPKQRVVVESSRRGKAREVTMEAEVPLESNPYPAVESADRVKSENNPEPQVLPFRGRANVATFRDLVLHVPQGMLAAVELIRLSRPDLQRWVDSPIIGARVEGFFLRLRFGHLEAQQGGTGYRMARIKGAAKRSAVGKSMLISVELGESECTIDGQFVSNQAFTEAELAEWWRGACVRGGSLITDTELECKLIERRSWPLAL